MGEDYNVLTSMVHLCTDSETSAVCGGKEGKRYMYGEGRRR